KIRPSESALTAIGFLGRWKDCLVQCRTTAVHLRCTGQSVQRSCQQQYQSQRRATRWATRRIWCERDGDFAGWQAHRLHPRLQSLGARRCDEQRDATHNRRHKRFWLCDEQCRLVEERCAGCSVVARFQEDGNVSARWAWCRRDVFSEHATWSSQTRSVEISAARRRQNLYD